MHRWKLYGIMSLLLALGLWLGVSMGRSAVRRAPVAKELIPPRPHPLIRERPLAPARTTERETKRGLLDDPEADAVRALPNQRTLTFASAEALRAFLEKIKGKGIAVLDSMVALHTLRVAFLSAEELKSLLDGTETMDFIYPAFVPGGGTVQPDAIGFGKGYLAWLGLEGDRSGYGRGVTVAILDTGILANGNFAADIRSFPFVAFNDDLSLTNPHGTAVAGIIAGENGIAPGITRILDFRIADDNGMSDTFSIARAIVAAADAGADIINISLGAQTGSNVLYQAIEYANAAGAVVIAAGGNDGLNSVSYPAAYHNVIAMGAVDARGEILDFSNRGNGVTMAAPGLELSTYGISGEPVIFSGTSASAPVGAGSVAVAMSQGNMTSSRAAGLLVANANEAGAPGQDPAYGEGIINPGRALNAGQQGINDIAVASHYLTTDASGRQIVQVVVENRGTTLLTNAPLVVTTPAGTQQINVSSLAAGAIQTYNIPVHSNGDFTVSSSVGLSHGLLDATPKDNTRTDQFTPAAGK